MSDKLERAFLGGRRIISWDRLKISLEIVEEIECLKDWKQGVLLAGF